MIDPNVALAYCQANPFHQPIRGRILLGISYWLMEKMTIPGLKCCRANAALPDDEVADPGLEVNG